MSHISKGAVKIKEVDMLNRACQKFGIVLSTDIKQYRGRFIGEQQCHAVMYPEGAQIDEYNAAMLVKVGDGYEIQMDNYRNPLANLGGANMEKVTQEYSIMLAEDAMANQGYVNVSRETTKNGDVVLTYENYAV